MSEGDVGSSGQAIANGTVDTANYFPGVGYVFIQGLPITLGGVTYPNTAACTGTLVGPQHVLTAKHCFDLPGPQAQATFTLGTAQNGVGGSAFVHTYNGANPVLFHSRFADGHVVDPGNTSLTPEGLILERPGPAVDRIYPLVQEGDSDVTYNDVTGGAWQGVFQ